MNRADKILAMMSEQASSHGGRYLQLHGEIIVEIKALQAEVDAKARHVELIDRLSSACVAGCTCMTKTPEVKHHDSLCHYRLFTEAIEALI